MMLPASLHPHVVDALAAADDHSPVQHVVPVSGGCINNALRIVTGKASYLLKYNQLSLPIMFSSEARGLELLRQTQTLRVPVVLAYANATESTPGFMLQEWIEGQPDIPQSHDEERLGMELAALHQSGSAHSYGLDHDNYIGHTPQVNGWDSDWVHF